jgi:prevent-host-death family protein
MIVNVSKAKTNLSELVDRVCLGETVIISKNDLPLVELVAYKPKKPRKLGLLKGQITIPDDFNEESSEINALFYGDE